MLAFIAQGVDLTMPGYNNSFVGSWTGEKQHREFQHFCSTAAGYLNTIGTEKYIHGYVLWP